MASQRKDRTNEQLRPICVELGALYRADGSARFSHGGTEVLVAVYGPVEVKHTKELIDRATIEVVFMPKQGVPGCSDAEKENIIRNTVDAVVLSTLHPRTSIKLIVQILNDEGSLLSAAINCACLALIDAGIALRGMVTSAACAIAKDGTLLIDPSAEEEQSASAVLVFAFHSTVEGIVTSKISGLCDDNQYYACAAACKQAANEVHTRCRAFIEAKIMPQAG